MCPRVNHMSWFLYHATHVLSWQDTSPTLSKTGGYASPWCKRCSSLPHDHLSLLRSILAASSISGQMLRSLLFLPSCLPSSRLSDTVGFTSSSLAHHR